MLFACYVRTPHTVCLAQAVLGPEDGPECTQHKAGFPKTQELSPILVCPLVTEYIKTSPLQPVLGDQCLFCRPCWTTQGRAR